MKVIRKLDVGENPEVEMGAALTRAGFEAAAPHLGSLEYRTSSEAMTVAVAQRFVHNEGDAWSHTVDLLGRDRLHTEDGYVMQSGSLVSDGTPRLTNVDSPPKMSQTRFISTPIKATRPAR